ncbi:MGMT family protein [Candidatus Parvarchaeota archaeon]|nr:MGMT family protein [Candidatus Parvarchaeota archaeon]
MEDDNYYKVYRILKRIPKGKVTTYGAIAKKLGINPRYVGYILSKNNHPDEYPCYKVVRSNGSIGGYTFDGKNNAKTSLRKKKKLISEGIKLSKSKVSSKSIIRRF